MRNNGTKAEACLWKYVLKARKLNGYPFKRQRPIGRYIADFMCIPMKLIIEVDGITHELEEVAARDKIRQKELESLGFKVVRYTDDEVLKHIEGVRNHLMQIIEDREKDFL